MSTAALTAIEQQASWITSAQLADGAIGADPPAPWTTTLFVNPYVANYAAMGLARATAVTGDLSYAQAAWRWLAWYASQEQPGTGYVANADVSVSGSEPVTSTTPEDSTDAYAGTFLLAAYDTEQVDPDPTALAGLEAGLAGAVQAITSTQQSSGLTWALPSYHAAYLMDQSETYAGLEAASSLGAQLGDSALSAQASSAASAMDAGIQGLWSQSAGSFAWAAFPDGVTTPANWANLYPDAMEEVWPVAFGAATGAQASSVLGDLATDEPSWDQPTASATYAGAGLQSVGYWVPGAWALEVDGQVAAGEAAAASIWQAAQQAEHWPFTVADAGQLIVAESGGPTLASAAS